MKKLTLCLIAAAALTGGLLRVYTTDWNKDRHLDSTGARLTRTECVLDLAIQQKLHPWRESRILESQPAPLNAKQPAAWGYPLFLEVCYRFFGTDKGPPLLQIQLLQNLLDIIASFLLVAAVGMLLNRPVWAWLTGAVYLIHPSVIRSSASLGAESLYTCVSILFLYCAIRFFKTDRLSRTTSTALGLSIGMSAVLCPANFGYLLFFIGIAGMLCFYTRRRVQAYLLVLLGCSLALGPWWFAQQLGRSQAARQVQSNIRSMPEAPSSPMPTPGE